MSITARSGRSASSQGASVAVMVAVSTPLRWTTHSQPPRQPSIPASVIGAPVDQHGDDGVDGAREVARRQR